MQHDEVNKLYFRANNRDLPFPSMHIRKTDMDLDLARTPKKLVSYDLFYKWVERQKELEPIFLMTDNRDTQQHFQEKYNAPRYPIEKILVYHNISDEVVQEEVSGEWTPNMILKGRIKDESSMKKSSAKTVAVDHRFTSLEHAVLDVFIAAHAWDFRPAPFSSVSDLVKMMNYLHR